MTKTRKQLGGVVGGNVLSRSTTYIRIYGARLSYLRLSLVTFFLSFFLSFLSFFLSFFPFFLSFFLSFLSFFQIFRKKKSRTTLP